MACDQAVWRAISARVDDLVVFHEGWIPDRFGDVAETRFCFVHLDVDLFQPTRDSLGFFYPRMVDGGLIVCDDYGFETCPGARRAVDEFFADRPEPIGVHLPTGWRGFVVIERARCGAADGKLAVAARNPHYRAPPVRAANSSYNAS